MPDYLFYHPIEVRYGDLDPQGHVNNAAYLTYFEQARIQYIKHLQLWKSADFIDIGIILADAHVTFKAPVLFGQHVQVGVRVTRLGNKSLTMEYILEDQDTRQLLATASTTLVTYEYHTNQTIPIPDDWRSAMVAFEHLDA
jgi:acyl-CoA thioester hydrolase